MLDTVPDRTSESMSISADTSFSSPNTTFLPFNHTSDVVTRRYENVTRRGKNKRTQNLCLWLSHGDRGNTIHNARKRRRGTRGSTRAACSVHGFNIIDREISCNESTESDLQTEDRAG